MIELCCTTFHPPPSAPPPAASSPPLGPPETGSPAGISVKVHEAPQRATLSRTLISKPCERIGTWLGWTNWPFGVAFLRHGNMLAEVLRGTSRRKLLDCSNELPGWLEVDCRKGPNSVGRCLCDEARRDPPGSDLHRRDLGLGCLASSQIARLRLVMPSSVNPAAEFLSVRSSLPPASTHTTTGSVAAASPAPLRPRQGSPAADTAQQECTHSPLSASPRTAR
ncbi:hypothetical protein ACVWYQ_006097 [Bradyrhizobium sp. USDA 3397]